MSCKFLNIYIKCCFECKVNDICPPKCSGFGSHGKNCEFYDNNIDALCVYENNVKKGEPLDSSVALM